MIPHCEQKQEEMIENENGIAMKFSGGTMIQYGSVIIAANEQFKTVKFPQEFKDNGYNFSISNIFNYSKAVIYSIAGATKDGISVYPFDTLDNTIPTKTCSARYIAIGRWK